MEALTRSNDIEEIQQLMEQFKIIEKENNQIIKVEMIEENEEVILNCTSSKLGYDSDPYFDEIYMERGETSNSKSKRKREDNWNPHSSWKINMKMK